ncbi:MAG: hypothetical protein II671_08290 [Salinivirgaceae bacterium]|nr:hypothetical protein [Salinivirgaceae bacterium]
MKKVKRWIAAVVLAMAVPTAALADDGYDYLVFSLQDGTSQSVTAVGTSITFSGTNAVVSNGSTKFTLSLADLASMFFSSDASTTGISTIDADGTSADNGEATEIYTLNGVRVDDMSKRGVYIVKKNGKTFKQVVR